MNSKTASLFFLLGPVTALYAHAEIYLTEEAAVKIIFPQDNLKDAFKKQTVELTPEEIALIEKKSGEAPRTPHLTLWKNSQKDLVFIDQVLGKHEFITYAVGITVKGKVAGIEILEYRESYGSQIRKPEWREQFHGKGIDAKLKLNDDIKNISGATLSSAHVTAGVKRILQTYDSLHGRL
jgi:Na+-translocating ferredoxin:NAD+ oxidoreductase RnfG subunit